MRILAEQECFKVRLNEAMETEFRTLSAREFQQ